MAGFLQLRDRSGELQVFCQKGTINDDEFALYKDVDIGDFVYVEGNLFRTKTVQFLNRDPYREYYDGL